MTGLTLATARAIASNFRGPPTAPSSIWAPRRVPCPCRWRWPIRTSPAAALTCPRCDPIFDTYVQSFGLSDRLQFLPGDFFTDPLPAADIFAMGRVLDDWDLATKRQLIAKVLNALPTGDAFLVPRP